MLRIKFAIAIAFVFLTHLISHAQCLLLNFNLHDCSSCYNSIIYLQPKQLKIPIYVVFEKQSREDSLELSQRFKFEEMGMEMVFSDSFYNLTKSSDHTTSLSLLDRRGTISIQKNLKGLSESFLRDSLMPQIQIETSNPESVIKYCRDRVYSFKYGLGTLRVNDRNGLLLKKISNNDFDFELLLSKLPLQKRKLLEPAIKFNKESVTFTPKFTWFDVKKDGSILLMFQYIIYKDVTKNEFFPEFCIVEYSSDFKLVNIYPIIQTEENAMFNPMFLAGENGAIILLTSSVKGLEEAKENTKFVSKFIVKDNQYTFDKYYDVGLPLIHRLKYNENELSLNYSNFPFMAFHLDNAIYNVETGAQAYVYDSNAYNSLINYHQDFPTQSEEKFRILHTTLDKDGVYVISQFGDYVWVNSYSKDLTFKGKQPLGLNNLGAEVLFINTDTIQRKLFVHLKNRKEYVLPLDLFL